MRIAFGLLALVAFSACTQQQVTDSAGVAARSLCAGARSCTVNDPKPY